MNALYVWKSEGEPAGPYTPEALARAIAQGDIAADAFVATLGASRWRQASQLAEVSDLLEGILRDSPLAMPAMPVMPALPPVTTAPVLTVGRSAVRPAAVAKPAATAKPSAKGAPPRPRDAGLAVSPRLAA